MTDYAARLRALRPYVNLSITARTRFTPSEKGKITRAWNEYGKLIQKTDKGDIKFRRMKASASKKLGLKRRTNKGIWLAKGVRASRLVKGDLNLYFGSKDAKGTKRYYKSKLVRFRKGIDIREQIEDIISANPGKDYALSINGYKAQLDRNATQFSQYHIEELIEKNVISGLYVTDYDYE